MWRTVKAVASRRDLLLVLAIRDFKTRYLNVPAGVAYTLLVSVGAMIALSVVFGAVLRGSVDVPYPAYVFTGMIPWSFLQFSVLQSVDSFRSGAAIVRKVAFPRALIPLGVVSANAFNMLISVLALLPFLLLSGIPWSPYWLALPVALAAVLLLAAGMAMIIATGSAFYVEFKPATDLLVMLWFYATPVFYPISIVPDAFQWVVRVNPMAHLVEVVRSLLLHGRPPAIESAVIAVVVPLVVFAVGAAVVRKYEGVIADHVG